MYRIIDQYRVQYGVHRTRAQRTEQQQSATRARRSRRCVWRRGPLCCRRARWWCRAMPASAAPSPTASRARSSPCLLCRRRWWRPARPCSVQTKHVSSWGLLFSFVKYLYTSTGLDWTGQDWTKQEWRGEECEFCVEVIASTLDRTIDWNRLIGGFGVAITS